MRYRVIDTETDEVRSELDDFDVAQELADQLAKATGHHFVVIAVSDNTENRHQH